MSKMGASNYLELSMSKPIRIPANVGLYYISSILGTAGLGRFARYSLL